MAVNIEKDNQLYKDLQHTNNNKLGGAQGASNAAASSGSTPDGDNILFMAMVALSEELNVLTDSQVSVAKLSSAMYDKVIPNCTNKLKDMQQKLDDYTWMQQHWSAFASYFKKGSGTPPSLGPGMSKGDLDIMKDFYHSNDTLTAARSSIGLLSQELNTQNTYVQDAKVIPDNLQQNEKEIENSQTQFSTMLPELLQLAKEQYTQSWH